MSGVGWPKLVDLICHHCGDSFKALRRDALYCGPWCKKRAYRKRHPEYERNRYLRKKGLL